MVGTTTPRRLAASPLGVLRQRPGRRVGGNGAGACPPNLASPGGNQLTEQIARGRELPDAMPSPPVDLGFRGPRFGLEELHEPRSDRSARRRLLVFPVFPDRCRAGFR